MSSCGWSPGSWKKRDTTGRFLSALTCHCRFRSPLRIHTVPRDGRPDGKFRGLGAPPGGGPKFAGFSGVSPSASGLRWPHRILLFAAVAPRPSRSHPSGLTAWLLTRYRDAPCSQEGPASRCGGWGEGGERKRREQCVPSTGSEAPAKRPLAGPPPSSLLGNR